MLKYRLAVGDFVPNVTITGVFTCIDYGKSFKVSRIAGHSVVDAANYSGGNRGFGRDLGIPNGAIVTATIAEINTKSGKVWVPGSIQSGNQQFVSRSPQEMYDTWRSDSYELIASEAFFHTLFISTALLAVCWIGSALIRRTKQ